MTNPNPWYRHIPPRPQPQQGGHSKGSGWTWSELTPPKCSWSRCPPKLLRLRCALLPTIAHTGTARLCPPACLEGKAVTILIHATQQSHIFCCVPFWFFVGYDNLSRCSAFKECALHFYSLGLLFKGTFVKRKS